jgi:hypothetical protein
MEAISGKLEEARRRMAAGICPERTMALAAARVLAYANEKLLSRAVEARGIELDVGLITNWQTKHERKCWDALAAIAPSELVLLLAEVGLQEEVKAAVESQHSTTKMLDWLLGYANHGDTEGREGDERLETADGRPGTPEGEPLGAVERLMSGPEQCVVCGCTEEHACEGGCSWMTEEDVVRCGTPAWVDKVGGPICSACVERIEADEYAVRMIMEGECCKRCAVCPKAQCGCGNGVGAYPEEMYELRRLMESDGSDGSGGSGVVTAAPFQAGAEEVAALQEEPGSADTDAGETPVLAVEAVPGERYVIERFDEAGQVVRIVPCIFPDGDTARGEADRLAEKFESRYEVRPASAEEKFPVFEAEGAFQQEVTEAGGTG